MVSLRNILTHILQDHGFEVFERDEIMQGEKDGSIVTVGIFDHATVSDVREHSAKVKDLDGRHIICVLEAGEMVEQTAAENGLVLWKKPDLEREIGNALISHISDQGHGHFSELISAKAPEGSDVGVLPVVIEDLGTGALEKVVRSGLTLEDVKEISKKTVKGFKHELELVPHYLFHYLCIFDGRDGEERKSQGLIAVNALTGKYASWPEEPVFSDENISSIVQLEAKLDSSAAEGIAQKGVVELNTEYKEILTEKEHATIIEKAIFQPKAENIVLEKPSLILVPVWCVEGSHGVMILDGFTGKVISEDYYQEGPSNS